MKRGIRNRESQNSSYTKNILPLKNGFLYFNKSVDRSQDFIKLKEGGCIKILDEFEITDRTKLRLQVGEFRGVERVDIRQYVKPKEGDVYIPTPKGINFDSEWLARFIVMVNKLADI